MGNEQKRILQQQLWNVASTLRGEMDAGEFRDYITGSLTLKTRLTGTGMINYSNTVLL